MHAIWLHECIDTSIRNGAKIYIICKDMRENEQKTRDELREIREEVTNVRDMLPKVR